MIVDWLTRRPRAAFPTRWYGGAAVASPGVANGATNKQGEATRTRLIRTAEELFAARGVDAASIRAVTAAAGQGPAAVNYHFGTKDDLLNAVLLDQGVRVAKEITDRLMALATSPRRPTLEDVVRALARPYLDLLLRDRARGMRWIKIMVQVSAQRRPGVDTARQDAVMTMLRTQVVRALPGTAEDRIAKR